MNETERLVEAAKAAIPVSVTTISILGVPVEQWMYIATFTYTVIMIVSFCYRFLKKIKK